ncbi:MAG: hypothetical protein NXH85_18655 [Pseudomonadaceae bacterium]|nr:hypothetical protein [Pseudomonadaceae bacterium]
MAELMVACGLGGLWLGSQIIWVARLPRQIRRFWTLELPTAEPGSATAFGLFWIDQYGWIGVTLCSCGLALVAMGLLS